MKVFGPGNAYVAGQAQNGGKFNEKISEAMLSRTFSLTGQF
jgi:hypothetical protein